MRNIIEISFESNKFNFLAHDPSGIDDGLYSLVCNKMEEIEKQVALSRKLGALPIYLKSKSGNGCWLDSASPQSSFRCYSVPVLATLNEFNQIFPSTWTYYGRTAINDDLDRTGILPAYRSEMKSRYHSDRIPDDPQIEYEPSQNLGKQIYSNRYKQSSYGNCHLYENVLNESMLDGSQIGYYNRNHYQSVPILNATQANYINSINDDFTIDQTAKVVMNSIEKINSTCISDSQGIHEYLNLQNNLEAENPSVNKADVSVSRSDTWPRQDRRDLDDDRGIVKENSFEEGSERNSTNARCKYIKQEQQKFCRKISEGNGAFRGRKMARQLHKSAVPRSADRESAMQRSASSREENWDRAKRIINRTHRSFNGWCDSKSKQMSMEAIAINVNGTERLMHLKSISSTTVGANSDGTQTKCESNVNDNGSQQDKPSTSHEKIDTLPGLVKLQPTKFALNRRNQISAGNLQKSITGSYSKYDGERSTHDTTVSALKCSPIADCIDSAVMKGRERLLEADRRNSNFVRNISRQDRYIKRHLNSISSENRFLGGSELSAQIIDERVGSVDGTNAVSSDWKTSSIVDGKCIVGSAIIHEPRFEENGGNDAKSAHSDYSKNVSTRAIPSKDIDHNGSMKQSSSEARGFVSKSGVAKKIQRQNSVTSQRAPVGNYCHLQPNSAESSLKSASLNPTLYTNIDPVATLAASKAQETMKLVRERPFKVNDSLSKSDKYLSELTSNDGKKPRHSFEHTREKNSFMKRLWKRTSMSLSYSDLYL